MDVREPNLYLLQGYGLQVSLALSSFSGKPQLTYHDAAQVRQFTGEEITFEDTVLGRFASVVLTSVPDLGTTIFSLVLPAVRLSGGWRQPADQDDRDHRGAAHHDRRSATGAVDHPAGHRAHRHR